jgi:non-specific serine/threonine protein kinase
MQAAITGDVAAAAIIATDDLKQIAGCDPHYSWALAECYSMLGDTSAALLWIEKAMERGFINYPMISRWDPLLDNARKSPEFPALADQVKALWENFEV